MPTLTQTNNQFTIISGVLTNLDPEYISLTLDQLQYNEGDTITATLVSRNIADSTTVSYTVTGISSNDLSSGSLNGSFTISNNQSTTSFTLANDVLTEGIDTFVITLTTVDSEGNSTNSLSSSATIQDTSNNPTSTPWLDDNDDIITVAQIISPIAMQVNAVFAVNPTVPITIEGRISGTTTTITNIAANTGSILELDDSGNSTSFTVGEELNLVT